MHVQTTLPHTYILFFLSHKFENAKIKTQGQTKSDATPKPDKGGGGKT
jgi:hypothetical protein